MMHSKKRIIKRVVIACLILVVSGVWLVGYIDVNKRFPKPEQQVHSIGEWVRTGDTSIKVNSVEYMPQEEANSQYGSELLPDNGNNSNTYYFIAKIDVKNETDKEIKLSKTLLEHLGLEIYPVGVLIYGEVMENGELTWRLYNAQMGYKRCAEVAPQGTFSCPSGNSPCRTLR